MMALWVTAAAGLGATCRYLLDLAVQHRTASALPLGTLLINITGSLGLGLVVGLGLYHGLSDTPRTIAGTGFLGAYTTFSTFSYETVRLIEDGSHLEAFLNSAANLLLGLAAAGTGLAPAAAL